MLRALLIVLSLLSFAFAQQQRGRIDIVNFKQSDNNAAVQFKWAYPGQVQIPKPIFRALVYYTDRAGKHSTSVAGSLEPAYDSKEAARNERSPSSGNQQFSIELPGRVRLNDYRVEMWVNGHLIGSRNRAAASAAAFAEKGLDTTWWVPKASKLDENMIKEISTCIDLATTWLMGEQQADGHWLGHGSSSAGFTSLAALALVKAGVAKDGPEITKAIAWLKKNKPQTIYDYGCLLMLLEAVDPVVHQYWIKELTGEVLGRQGNGTWSYRSGDGDLSCSQYAALGLWAAQRAGIGIQPDVWRELGEAMSTYKNEKEGFNYQPKHKPQKEGPARLPMTAAGTGIALICYKMTDADKRSIKLRPKLAEMANAGYRATAHKFSNRASGYSLYGIERAAALIDRDMLGQHDWYKEGAQIFIDRQLADGSIDEGHLGGKIAGTSFALLFLRLSTRSAIDPTYDPDAHLKAVEASNAVAEVDGPALDELVPAAALDPVEADFNKRFPPATIGATITLRSSDGKSVSGEVQSIDTTAIVIDAGGRTVTIPFSRLDKPSRARCDAAFRQQAIDERRNR